MSKTALTDRALRALTRPKPAPVALFDTDVRQLQVRASVTGTVSFSVLKRPPGSRKLARYPIGSYPLTTLAAARTKAREVALVWRATEGMEAGAYVRLLLLLGVRRCELGKATYGEFDLDNAVWIVPAGRMKGDESHVIPLPPTAVELLRACLLGGPLPRPGARVFDGIHYSTVKTALDARVKALNGGKALPRWTWHDCRRTFRTGLSTIGIRPDIAELCIAHRQKGLARVYDQHRFDREKRDAFALWERHLLGIFSPPADNVRPLRRTS